MLESPNLAAFIRLISELRGWSLAHSPFFFLRKDHASSLPLNLQGWRQARVRLHYHSSNRSGRAMGQAGSRRLLITGFRVRTHVSPRGTCGRKRDTGKEFPLSTSVSPVSNTPTTLQSHTSLICHTLKPYQLKVSLKTLLCLPLWGTEAGSRARRV